MLSVECLVFNVRKAVSAKRKRKNAKCKREQRTGHRFIHVPSSVFVVHLFLFPVPF